MTKLFEEEVQQDSGKASQSSRCSSTALYKQMAQGHNIYVLWMTFSCQHIQFDFIICKNYLSSNYFCDG